MSAVEAEDHSSGSSQNASINVPGSPGRQRARRADASEGFRRRRLALGRGDGMAEADRPTRRRDPANSARSRARPRASPVHGRRRRRRTCDLDDHAQDREPAAGSRRATCSTSSAARAIGGCGVACVSLAKDTEEHSGRRTRTRASTLISQVLPAYICHFLRTGHKVPSPVIDSFFKDTVLSTLGQTARTPRSRGRATATGCPGSACRTRSSCRRCTRISTARGSPSCSRTTSARVSKGGRFQGPSADNWPLWEMLAATTRAPTFFEPWEKKGHEVCRRRHRREQPGDARDLGGDGDLDRTGRSARWSPSASGHSLNTAHKAKKRRLCTGRAVDRHGDRLVPDAHAGSSCSSRSTPRASRTAGSSTS